jgi:hypothetical protein
MEKSADLVHARWTVGCTIPWWTEDRATAGNSPEHTLLADSSHGGSPQLRGKEEGGAPILTMGYLGRRGGWYKLAKRVRAWRWGCSDDAMAGVGRTTKCGRKSCSGGCTMSRAPPFPGMGGGGSSMVGG